MPLWLNVPWSNKGALGTNKQISLLSAFAVYISTSKQGLEIELVKFKSLKTRTKPVGDDAF